LTTGPGSKRPGSHDGMTGPLLADFGAYPLAGRIDGDPPVLITAIEDDQMAIPHCDGIAAMLDNRSLAAGDDDRGCYLDCHKTLLGSLRLPRVRVDEPGSDPTDVARCVAADLARG
jgi:hypothetical protein